MEQKDLAPFVLTWICTRSYKFNVL